MKGSVATDNKVIHAAMDVSVLFLDQRTRLDKLDDSLHALRLPQ